MADEPSMPNARLRGGYHEHLKRESQDICPSTTLTARVVTQLAQDEQVFELPEKFTTEQREQLFQQILLFYELMDEVKAAAAVDSVQFPELPEIVTVELTQIRFSIDFIMALYNQVVFQGHPITLEIQELMETTLRGIFEAIGGWAERVDELVLNEMGKEIDPAAITVIEALAITLPPLPDNKASVL